MYERGRNRMIQSFVSKDKLQKRGVTEAQNKCKKIEKLYDAERFQNENVRTKYQEMEKRLQKCSQVTQVEDMWELTKEVIKETAKAMIPKKRQGKEKIRRKLK